MAYIKPSMFKRTGKFFADTVKWAGLGTMRGAKALPSGMQSFAGGMGAAGMGLMRGSIAAGKYAIKNPGKTVRYGMIGTGGALALGAGVAGVGSSLAKGAFGVANKTMRGILPNSQYPAASGMFGTRTASQAGPAGIEGLRFNFRRR